MVFLPRKDCFNGRLHLINSQDVSLLLQISLKFNQVPDITAKVSRRCGEDHCMTVDCASCRIMRHFNTSEILVFLRQYFHETPSLV